MRIVIATPLYPPEVGGPSYYASGLADALRKKGHVVRVVPFGWLKRLPVGIRHIAYGFRVLTAVIASDVIIALDTFSVALPAVFIAQMFRKNILIRTGGDFLWEHYVERTGAEIPLTRFYASAPALSVKERKIYFLTKWALTRAHVIFSTEFQRAIWLEAYGLKKERTHLIENAIEPMLPGEIPSQKNFLFFTRNLTLKNIPRMRSAFEAARRKFPEIVLEQGMVPKNALLEKMRSCYAVVLPSYSEVSPNYILDALRFRKPFILSKYSGYADLLKDFGLIVDPFDDDALTKAVESLASDAGYSEAVTRAARFSLKERTYDIIADEFIQFAETIA